MERERRQPGSEQPFVQTGETLAALFGVPLAVANTLAGDVNGFISAALDINLLAENMNTVSLFYSFFDQETGARRASRSS